jgi:hypothetical protein
MTRRCTVPEPLIRVLVTGGRDYADRAAVTRALSHLGGNFIFGALPEEIVLVHGACAGADTLAAEEAAKLGWRTEAHPADWDTHGTAAGPIRNKEMVSRGGHYLVAFAGGSGTAHCRRLALTAHIPVIDVKEKARV